MQRFAIWKVLHLKVLQSLRQMKFWSIAPSFEPVNHAAHAGELETDQLTKASGDS